MRKKGKLKWLRPDAKSQVTLRYDGNTVLGLDAVVLSPARPGHQAEDLVEAVRAAEILVPCCRRSGWTRCRRTRCTSTRPASS